MAFNESKYQKNFCSSKHIEHKSFASLRVEMLQHVVLPLLIEALLLLRTKVFNNCLHLLENGKKSSRYFSFRCSIAITLVFPQNSNEIEQLGFYSKNSAEIRPSLASNRFILKRKLRTIWYHRLGSQNVLIGFSSGSSLHSFTQEGWKRAQFLGEKYFKRSITEKEYLKGTENDGIVCASVNKEMRATFARWNT